MTVRQHWNSAYERAATENLGWYEPVPSNLSLVTSYSTHEDSVIDVGAGDSRLVDALLALGYRDVTVLDVSEVALERARGRLGPRSRAVGWIHADISTFAPERSWDVWHDRAVFHFLVTNDERDAYRSAALRAIVPGGLLVVTTFGSEGPEECAGLPVCRYTVDSLPLVFAPEFELVDVRPIDPGHDGVGDQRPYIGAVLRRCDY